MSPMPRAATRRSTSAKLTCRLCGSRCSSDPLTMTPSTPARRPGEQPVAQRAPAARSPPPSPPRQIAHACAEPDDARHVQRAGPHAALLAAADDERLELGALADVERAAALRAVHLVARERQQIDVHRADVDRESCRPPARHPRGRRAPARVRDRADLGERLHHADLVVGGHHADERRVGVTSAAERLEIDDGRRGRPARRVTRQPCALEPLRRLRAPTCARSPTRRCAAAPARPRARATPLMARLLDSVAPLVKTISRAVAPMSAATSRRAALDGLLRLPSPRVRRRRRVAEVSVKYGSIASSTRGSTGVVAW